MAEGVFTAVEREVVILAVAQNPLVGDLVPGTSGLRKLRVAARGKGKRGGARIIYYFGSPRVPVLLLAAYAKGERSDLTAAEKRLLAALVSEIVAEFLRTSEGKGK